ALLLFAVFRTLSGVLWPMATVVLALGSTLGIMAATGIPLTMPTQILPSFVMAVGVGDSVHILAIFYRRLRMGDSRENAMAFAMGHSGLAIVLTSVTTAGGLLSFATAEIAPIAHLGIFAATGVLLALFYTLVFLPAMVAIFPPQAPKRKDSAEVQPLDRFLASVGDLATRRPWTILSVTAVLLALGFTGAMNLKFSHDPMRWLPPDAPIRVDSDFISGKLKGTVTMEALVDAGRPGAFHEPKNLAALDTLAAEAEAYHQEGLYVGQTSSVVDVLKEIHQAVNENRPEFYALPGDRRLAAQELLLFENAGSDDLEQLVDPDFSMARLTFKLPSMDAQAYEGFSRHMETRFHEEFGPDVEVRFTGLVSLLSRTFTAVMRTMAESYVIAFGVITLLMILLIGSFRIGLVSMIPNVAPIILCLGLMKLIHVPLNAFTILIGSVAIGLAVDDTIHFMHNFRRYLGMTKSVAEAVHETLQTTGRAMLFTSIVLSCGFYVLCFASMDITIRFGMLTGTAILFALAADFLVAPALMAVIFRKHPA
ncbi:MAG: efflux RND transporter permease subunit, partial [Pseudomonadota bacterium]